ncbi:MAG: hypothetical protein AB7S68_24355 [Polyangiaceae bacterium]
MAQPQAAALVSESEARRTVTTVRLSAKWLVSPRYDLCFFIGSCVVTWLFLGLYHLLGALGLAPRAESVLLTYFVFTAFFDHPHIFQTFSRTHLDPIERRRHRFAHTWGLALFIVGGYALAALKVFPYVIVFAAVFGSWHIMRQHWGILRAYKALNNDRAKTDERLDFALFWSGAAALYLHDYTDNPPQTEIYGKLVAPFPSFPAWFGDGLLWCFLTVLFVYVVRQVIKVRRGEALNLPKLLLLVAALGTHGLVFFATATPFLVAEALETTYHDLQYQGWVRHYQTQRFARSVAKRWLKVGLVYGLVVGCCEVLALIDDDRFGWLFVPFGMIVLWHYWVDGKIWKLRRQPELRSAIFER